MKKFLDCISIVGATPSKFHGTKKYVSTGAVATTEIDESEVVEVTYEDRPSRANLSAEAGDILFAKMQGTRKTLLLDSETEENIYSTGFYAVRANPEVITTECLYYLIDSELFLAQKDKNCSGATQKAITNGGMAKIEISVPALSEQGILVDKLKHLTQLIADKKKQLNLFDEIIKSRFIEMFGDPVYNTLKLPTKPLSELGSLDRGRSKHRPRNDPRLLGGPYPLIQTGEVSNAGLYITGYQNTYSELGLKQSKMWKAGTLCITIAANIAQTAILTFDACFPDSVVGFIPTDEINIIYMHYWFSFFQKILDEQAPQVAQKNINLKILSELQVAIPSIEEQSDFATFVEQVDKSKFEIQQSLEKLEILKKSLMQQYFG